MKRFIAALVILSVTAGYLAAQAEITLVNPPGAGGGGTAEVAFVESSRIYVDWRNDTGTEDGTIYRPFSTLQAAADSIPEVTSLVEFDASPDWEINVAPGVYNVTNGFGAYTNAIVLPFTRSLHIELRSAKIMGNVVRPLRHFEVGANAMNGRYFDLSISGNRIRNAFGSLDAALVGIQGYLYQVADPQGVPDAASSFWYRTVINRASVLGGVVYDGEAASSTMRGRMYGQLFLDNAHINGLWNAEEGPRGITLVTLFAQGWNMGHQGGSGGGQGIGPLYGNIIPYNLQNTMITPPMHITYPWGVTSMWHNVTFEPGDYQIASNVVMGVILDTASYNSWKSVTTTETRQRWHSGDKMVLTDSVDLSGYVQDTDPAYAAAVTNVTGTGGITVTGTGRERVVDGAGKLNLSGGTMTGDLVMGTNMVSGQRFGVNAGFAASGNEWGAYGYGAGFAASGNDWGAYGFAAGSAASGNNWGAYGHNAGISAVHTNSHSFGRFAGVNARGNNRLYIDVYGTNPDYAADGATNDTIFLESNGHLYLGGGASRAENPSAGGTLRGPWTVDGSKVSTTSAKSQIHPLSTSTNITVSGSHLTQAITNIAAATTIQWPEFAAAEMSRIHLAIPPHTNSLTLGNTNRVTYRYAAPLTDGPSTNRFSNVYLVSEYGTTNATAIVTEGSAP